eukprot:Skav218507  [mRNA]  locus=scaffold1564:100037:101053:+ [translate_table: standard]
MATYSVAATSPVLYTATSPPPAAAVYGGGGSYVPVPPVTPGVNTNLMEGIPDPDSIEQQRRAYERGLDLELEQTRKLAEEQLKQQKIAIKQAAEQSLAMYKAQVEQSIKQQELSLDHQWQQQQMELQQAFLKQKAALEHQASSLAMEYQQRKMHEALLKKQAEMDQEMHDMHQRIHLELHEHQQQQADLQQQHAVQRQQHQEELAAQQAKYFQHSQPGHVWAAPLHSSFSVTQPTPASQVLYQARPTPYQAPTTAAAAMAAMPATISRVSEPPAEPMVLGQGFVQQLPTYPDLPQPLPPQNAPTGAASGLASYCTNCGADFLPDALFCRKCGAKRPQA